jgi:hypothetical protein
MYSCEIFDGFSKLCETDVHSQFFEMSEDGMIHLDRIMLGPCHLLIDFWIDF